MGDDLANALGFRLVNMHHQAEADLEFINELVQIHQPLVTDLVFLKVPGGAQGVLARSLEIAELGVIGDREHVDGDRVDFGVLQGPVRLGRPEIRGVQFAVL